MFDFNVNVMNKSINNNSLTEMTIHLDWNIFQSRRSGQLQNSRDSLSYFTTHQQRKQTPGPLDSGPETERLPAYSQHRPVVLEA